MDSSTADLVIFRTLAPGVNQFFFRVCGATSEVMVSDHRALQIAHDIQNNCDLKHIGG